LTRSGERGGARRLGLGLAVLGTLAAAGGLAWQRRDAILESSFFASPVTQVRKVLAEVERASLDLGAGGRLELTEVRFADVAAQAAGDRVEVIAMVDGRGAVAWRGQRIGLGYVGREAFAMSRCAGGGWCSEGTMLPALRGILLALEARTEGAPPGRRVEAWQIRVERDRATAGEDLAQDGAAGAGPRREVHQLRRIDGRWEIVAAP
jgi:hypothetical protein